jgi:hypothetical protein
VQCRAAAHNRAHAAKGSLSSELAHELFALLGVSLLHSDSLDSCPLLVRVRLRNRRNGKSVSVSAHAKNAQAQQMRLSDAWPQQLSKPRQRTRERNDVAHIRGCLARLAQCSGHMHTTACFARGQVVVGGHHAPDSQRAHRPSCRQCATAALQAKTAWVGGSGTDKMMVKEEHTNGEHRVVSSTRPSATATRSHRRDETTHRR